MELPKNIIQIGKPDKLHKIFVEDYVVSYIKQTNRKLQGNQAGLAFYGRKTVEENIRYYFLYGASAIAGLERRGQYLSELERESIEAVQQEHFAEYEFLAWCTLTGEMPDGFYLMEQGKGLRIDGYACFFEKNDCMLNFMVAEGNREREREKLQRDAQAASAGADSATDREERLRQQPGGQTMEWGRLTGKGNIDHRLEERSRKLAEMRETQGTYRKSRVQPRQRAEKKTSAAGNHVEGWKPMLVGAAVLLCVLGIATLGDEERRRELQVIARQVMESLGEQKLPDQPEEMSGEAERQSEDGDGESGSMFDISGGNFADGARQGPEDQEDPVNQDTAQAADSQGQNSQDADAIDQNGPGTDGQSGGSVIADNPNTQNTNQEQHSGDQVQESQGSQTGAGQEGQSGSQEQTDAGGEKGETQQTDGQATTVTYVIQKGDTLLNICRKKYGTESKLREICELNGITNADDIKIGQIILLPE